MSEMDHDRLAREARLREWLIGAHARGETRFERKPRMIDADAVRAMLASIEMLPDGPEWEDAKERMRAEHRRVLARIERDGPVDASELGW